MIAGLADAEIEALAFVVQQVRGRTKGADPWDRPGIVAHLRKLDLTPGDALTVALLAAGDPAARMPIAITWHQYRDAVTPRTTDSGQQRDPTCKHCHRSRRACLTAQRNTGQDPHDYQPRRDQR